MECAALGWESGIPSPLSGRGWSQTFSVQFVAGHITTPSERNTVYALATPPGRGGIGVIRISGSHARDVWTSMLVSHSRVATNAERRPLREPGTNTSRILFRCMVVHPRTREVLDDGMAVFFHAPNTYTSRDVLELHIHSGRAVTSAVLSALSHIPTLRPAEPGEFTRWAFESGRIDLTEAEGIRDLVDAETDGETKKRFEVLRNDVIRCLASVEALIDFGEGEEIEEGVYDSARLQARNLRNTISQHLDDNRRGEILRSGIRLAIFGPPNVGKSSLLNYLVANHSPRRQAAIVTPLPGTTRDVLEVSLDIGGMPVIACDTAGLRDTDDIVERIGVERAGDMIQGADVVLCLLSIHEATAAPHIPQDVAAHIDKNTIIFVNKTDLLSLAPNTLWMGSVLHDQGMSQFMDGLVNVLKVRFHGSGDGADPLITHVRHRTILQNALQHLDAFLELGTRLQGQDDIVPGAEELRYVAQEIGRISGAIGVEDVLDSVFRDFCIGK
ncbi:hypothetical protein BS47DRAFT_1373880 [Hydnum rufescens UP504]|uniref:tRNA modification GTPase n=1 Tax=Hydnum rufescens UP504 TaxID=1448309 RepID=A0A9P6ALE0_9AGAM|nr:hypothetical protein BS47DRAFT_1373880 [Hydnum rufescens UP504]